jgi:hypothetical protein
MIRDTDEIRSRRPESSDDGEEEERPIEAIRATMQIPEAAGEEAEPDTEHVPLEEDREPEARVNTQDKEAEI